MKIFTAGQVRKIDDYTIKNEPVASIDLMERASSAFTLWFIRHFDISRPIIVFAGSGNNGGDALAIARMLLSRNYRVAVNFLKPGRESSSDCKINYNRLIENHPAVINDLSENEPLPPLPAGSVIIDGIFGSGLTRPVTGFPAVIIDHINRSRLTVVSIDIPSGL
jgi:NAD(P)H-hydrate epimerase